MNWMKKRTSPPAIAELKTTAGRAEYLIVFHKPGYNTRTNRAAKSLPRE
jgi:hypothetical protein